MTGRRLWIGIATAALAATTAGSTRAGGVSLLDTETTEAERARSRDWLSLSREKVAPARLPAAVTRAAGAAVPGWKPTEAFVLRHRPITSFRDQTEFVMKGRDADGREATVRTYEDGSRPMVTALVPIKSVPESELVEGRRYAAEQGYTLTRALVVTRAQWSVFRTSQHVTYYLLGTHPDRPGVERFVWLAGKGRFHLRDLDDVFLKEMGAETAGK